MLQQDTNSGATHKYIVALIGVFFPASSQFPLKSEKQPGYRNISGWQE